MLKRIPKWIWIISAVFLIMQYLICLNVYMMGDDYMYGTFGQEGVFFPVFSYYFSGNGRWLINICDSFLLIFDRYLYVIVTPWLLFLLGYLVYVLVSMLTGKHNAGIFASSIGLLSLIDVQMTCETTYWITGSMNYLVPSMLLIASMIAVLKLFDYSLSFKRSMLYGLICIAACLTMEQYGLMAIGWMLLMWGYDYLKNKKVKKRNLAIFLMSLVALSSIIFAPGNFVRAGDAAVNGNSLLTKAIDLIYYDYYSKVSSSFVFILAALSAFRFFKADKKLYSFLSAFNAAILLIFYDYSLIRSPFTYGISILLSLVTIIPTLLSSFRKAGRFSMISLAIIGGGSQLMLLASDLWGFRTSLSWIMIYIICILVILSDDYSISGLKLFICILCMAVNPYLGVAGVVISSASILSKKSLKAVEGILFAAVIIVALGDEVKGYYGNRDIHMENIQTVEEAKNNDLTSVIILPYDDARYGWNSPPLSEFHERYFRSYYDIPNSIVINYEEKE